MKKNKTDQQQRDDELPQDDEIDSKEIERKGAPIEFKFVGDEQPGVFEGYGSVFHNIDSYGDMVLPGAFGPSLAEHKAKGTAPGMYAEHSIYTMSGDLLPVGKWLSVEEDDHGLRVKGKISALDTDVGRRLRSLMRDGAMTGLSIAYQVPKGGAIFGDKKKPSEPIRTLRQVNLASIDIVRDPANGSARIDSIKSLLVQADHAAACKAVADCIKMHMATMSGNDSPNLDERAQMLGHLKAAHKALTGNEMPAGMKHMPKTLREGEAWLRERLSLTHTQARALAECGMKSLLPREEGQDQATVIETVHRELASIVTGFALPKF